MSSVKKTSYNVNSIISKYIVPARYHYNNNIFGEHIIKIHIDSYVDDDDFNPNHYNGLFNLKLLLSSTSNKYYQAFARNDF